MKPEPVTVASVPALSLGGVNRNRTLCCDGRRRR